MPADKQLTPDAEGLPAVGNRLAITQVSAGRDLVYYVGAGWSRSGDFPDEAAWTAYIRRFAERRDAPVKVSAAP